MVGDVMNVFRYLSCEKSLAEVYEIYKVIQNLKPYAIIKYKGLWEDALDEAFFHITENFDSSKGDLEHYATKVVGTILLNKNKKESANSEQTELSMDLQTAKDFSLCNNQEVAKDEDFEKCLRDLVAIAVKDLKFFATMNSKDRKMSYRKIFDKYSIEVIQQAQEYISRKYQDSITRLLDYSKNASIRDFKEDRYLKSLDSGITYEGCLNGVILFKKKQGSHNKNIYRVDLKETLNSIFDVYYSSNDFGRIEIEGVPVYVTMSGIIVESEKELIEILERELVGSLLSRTSLKVVMYNRGNEILFSSTKDDYIEVSLPIFDSEYVVVVDRIISKEVA